MIVKRQSGDGTPVLGVRFEMEITQDPAEENNDLFANPGEKLQEIMDAGARKKISKNLESLNASFTIDENVAVEAVLSRMISDDFRKRLNTLEHN